MCKHIEAVLYGVGTRLDQKPELLFSLRRVDAKDLVSQAGAGLPQSKKAAVVGKVLDSSMLADVFGIEMDKTAAGQGRWSAQEAGTRQRRNLRRGRQARRTSRPKRARSRSRPDLRRQKIRHGEIPRKELRELSWSAQADTG